MSTHTIRNVAPAATPSAMKVSKHMLVGATLLLALLAFEIFNFDTTRFALDNLLGGSSFVGLKWATVLAIAFCAIDFAGLARIFTPEQGLDEPKEVWYLMGAWLLGATMNAIMTWWAVSLTLLESDFGNEVLSRDQLLTYVPVFVAVLVWLTRILFIGALSVAGDHILNGARKDSAETETVQVKRQVVVQQPQAVRLMPTDTPQHRPQQASIAYQPTIEIEPEPVFVEPVRKKSSVRKVANHRPMVQKQTKSKPRTQVRPIPRQVPQQMPMSAQPYDG